MKQYYLVQPVCSATVVSWFLSLHDYWFRDPANAFYGKREEIAEYLCKWIELGTDLASNPSNLEIIASNKLHEWLKSSWAVKGTNGREI